MFAQAKLGDLLPDNPDRDNPGLVRADNVLPNATSYTPANNIVEESSALDSLCRGAVGLTDDLGVVHNYAGDLHDLYERKTDTDEPGGITFVRISRAPNTAPPAYNYTLPETHNWDFTRAVSLVTGASSVIVANGIDPIQEQVGFSGNFEDMLPTSGADDPLNENTDPIPTLRYIAPVREFIMGGWTAAQTNLLKWSAIGDPNWWTPTFNQSGEQLLPRGGQITGVVGGEYGVVFCEQSIYRINYAGDPEIVFQIDEISPGHGTTAPGSIAQYGENIFFIDTDGFYIFNGSTAEPIGSNRLNDTFLKDYDSEFSQRVISAVDISRSLIWWGYPSNEARTDSNGEKVPDKIIVYDWTSGRFAGPLFMEVEELVYSETSTSFMLDDVTPINFPDVPTINAGADVDLDQFPYQLDAGLFKGGNPRMQAFSFNHKQSSFTGPPLRASIEVGESMLVPGGKAFVTGLRALVDGNTPNITVRTGTRNATYGEVTWSAERPPNPRTGSSEFRANAFYHRFEINVDGDYDHIFGGEVTYTGAGSQ